VEAPTEAALAINCDDADVVAGTEKAFTSGNVRCETMNEPALRERAARGAEPVAPME
jgi:hypothetical protein